MDFIEVTYRWHVNFDRDCSRLTNCLTALFDRFMSKERNEFPCIEVELEHERREEVIQYLYQ